MFLALGGTILAFVRGAPSFTVLPELALALFVAPVLLDAAYDASPRDLKDNWAPVTGLVVFAVGLTTIAVGLGSAHADACHAMGTGDSARRRCRAARAAAATSVLRELNVKSARS